MYFFFKDFLNKDYFVFFFFINTVTLDFFGNGDSVQCFIPRLSHTLFSSAAAALGGRGGSKGTYTSGELVTTSPGYGLVYLKRAAPRLSCHSPGGVRSKDATNKKDFFFFLIFHYDYFHATGPPEIRARAQTYGRPTTIGNGGERCATKRHYYCARGRSVAIGSSRFVRAACRLPADRTCVCVCVRARRKSSRRGSLHIGPA